MSYIIDASTGLKISDPDKKLFTQNFKTNSVNRKKTLESMIISASGWRKVFAADRDEDSATEEVNEDELVVAVCAANAFHKFVVKKTGQNNPCILVAMDARPTGPLLADAMIRSLINNSCEIIPYFLAAAPEIMAAARMTEEAAGFIYISASHNPLGHNGFKFGLNDGGVLNGENNSELTRFFYELIENDEEVDRLVEEVQKADPGELKKLYEEIPAHKNRALRQYAQFTKNVITGYESIFEQEKIFARLMKFEKPIGIIAEFNGSARTTSIDIPFLKATGFRVKTYNDKPRQVVHAIVPEGKSLDLCCELLEKAYETDNCFILGYVPDNDGDRGNIVFLNQATGKARALEAQEVFALAVLSELSYVASLPESIGRKLAVVVNGPTSLRIDEIANAFDAEVFRSEVGEANAVQLAESLRNKHYIVRILGEGSNGGNITHPSRVRDPINTIFALAKLLLLRQTDTKPGLFEYWCQRSSQSRQFTKDFSLHTIIASLPAYTTTSAFSEKAIMHIKTSDHAALKAGFECIFLSEWEDKKHWLKEELGIEKWEEINYEKTEAKHGFGPDFRSGKETGGIKILFKTQKNFPVAFIWARGSGTEPVFRIMADVKGRQNAKEEQLLSWIRDMISNADALCCGK